MKALLLTLGLVLLMMISAPTTSVAGAIKVSSSSHGGASHQKKPRYDEQFLQWDSTRFLNSDTAPVADWEQLPWSGMANSVTQIGRGESSPPTFWYLIGVNNNSEFWTIDSSDATERPVKASSFKRLYLEACAGSECINKTGTSIGHRFTDQGTLVIPTGHNQFIMCQQYRPPTYSTLSCGYVSIGGSTGNKNLFQAGPTFYVSNVSSIAGESYPVRAAALQSSLDHVTQDGVRTPVSLLFASFGGLTALQVTNSNNGSYFTSGQASPIVLTNTTGGATINGNVTNVWCFPPEVQPSYFQPKKTAEEDDGFINFYQGQCYASTANQVCLHNVCPPNLVHRILGMNETYFYRTPGIIDRVPNGKMAFDTSRNAVHMGNDKCLNVLFANDSLWRVEGKTGGLPYHKIQSVTASNPSSSSNDAETGNIWHATEKGVNMMKPDGSWKYFYDSRWLPATPDPEQRASANSAIDVATKAYKCANALSNNLGACETAIVLTKGGLSVITSFPWTMEEKASAFQEVHDLRHDYFGLSAGVPLASFGNVSSWVQGGPGIGTDANDGLWSSIYLHGQAFRYAVTKDPNAKANAKKTFNGMKMLFEVTGIPGYPARSFKNATSSPGKGWHKSPTMPGVYYQSQTSSDEITGHMSAYPIYYDLVCETDEEKKDAEMVIRNLVSTIVDHNLDLVGEDGKPTLWGRWSIRTVNFNPFYYDGRGLNACEILMILSGGYRITKNETYAEVFMDLVNNHGYSESCIGAKITQVSDVNYSDDELTFLSYLGLLWASGVPSTIVNGSQPTTGNITNKLFTRIQRDLLVSIQRSFYYKSVFVEKSNWWHTLYAAYLKSMGKLSSSEEQSLIADGADFCFKTWPVSWVNWPVDNSHRLDISMNPHTEDVHAMENILPYDETFPGLLWNGSPFSLTAGNGYGEQDGSAWLTPYWTARYFGFYEKSMN